MSTFVLVRPGYTDFDEQNRIQGSLDLPLNQRGQGQLREIVNALRDVPLDAVYTSPSEPARTTAKVIGQELGIPVKEKRDLRNLDQGLWQGLPVDEIRRKYPKVFKQWQDAPETICPPEGELVSQAMQRIQKALHKLLKRKKPIAVVASEPLATLVCCFVRGTRPEFAGTVCACPEDHLVEFLESNGATGNGASLPKTPEAATGSETAEAP